MMHFGVDSSPVGLQDNSTIIPLGYSTLDSLNRAEEAMQVKPRHDLLYASASFHRLDFVEKNGCVCRAVHSSPCYHVLHTVVFWHIDAP